jgi:hypothetical protein
VWSSGGITVVEQLFRFPKFVGSNPAAAGTAGGSK